MHGFLPYQLVFGKNTNLPSVLNNKLPALEEIPSTEIISANLKAMQEARKAFAHSESSEILKRALQHNTRMCNNLKLLCGDSVYYKRNNSKRWKGPGKVLGQYRQQTLIKHGSYYISCHPYHITAQNKHVDKLKDPSDSSVSQKSTSNNHPVYDDCFDSSEDEKTNNAEEMSTSNADIENNAFEKSTIGKLKKHQAVRYLPKDCTEWKQTQIISCGGKATGKFKGCWKTQENEDEPVKYIDFERDVQEFRTLDEPNLYRVVDNLSDSMQALEINVSEVSHNSIKTETEEEKQKELAAWIQDVYKGVPNEGQKTI